MNALRWVLVAFLTQDLGAPSTPSEEARCLEYLEQARFPDLAAFLEKLPKDSACRLSLEGRVRRLVGIRERLIEAINRNEVDVDFKEVNPKATTGGRVVGATPTVIKVKGSDRDRQMIWAGLPAGVTYELARKFLEKEAKEDAALFPDLAEGLGLVTELRALNSRAADELESAKAFRKAILERSLEQAKSVVKGALTEKSERCWGSVARLWLARLEKIVVEQAKRREEMLKKLPKGTSMVFWHDFEEGPELVSPGWERGLIVQPPDGASPGNRWSRRSVFVGRGLDWGEMIDEFDASSSDPSAPVFTLKDNTWVSMKVFAMNVNKILVALDNAPHDRGERYSIVEVMVPAMGRWVDLKVRLDDVSKHRTFRGLPLIRVGDPVWQFILKAHRADRNKDDAHFFLDDIRVYTMPPDEVEDK